MHRSTEKVNRVPAVPTAFPAALEGYTVESLAPLPQQNTLNPDDHINYISDVLTGRHGQNRDTVNPHQPHHDYSNNEVPLLEGIEQFNFTRADLPPLPCTSLTRSQNECMTSPPSTSDISQFLTINHFLDPTRPVVHPQEPSPNHMEYHDPSVEVLQHGSGGGSSMVLSGPENNPRNISGEEKLQEVKPSLESANVVSERYSTNQNYMLLGTAEVNAAAFPYYSPIMSRIIALFPSDSLICIFQISLNPVTRVATARVLYGRKWLYHKEIKLWFCTDIAVLERVNVNSGFVYIDPTTQKLRPFQYGNPLFLQGLMSFDEVVLYAIKPVTESNAVR